MGYTSGRAARAIAEPLPQAVQASSRRGTGSSKPLSSSRATSLEREVLPEAELAHDVGDVDVAPVGLSASPGGELKRRPEELDRSPVTGSPAESPIRTWKGSAAVSLRGRQPPLDRAIEGFQRTHHRRERRHDAVAGLVDLGAPVGVQSPTPDPVVGPHDADGARVSAGAVSETSIRRRW